MEGYRIEADVSYIGVRPFTFFEKGVVGHVGFADPFDEKIAKVRLHSRATGTVGILISNLGSAGMWPCTRRRRSGAA